MFGGHYSYADCLLRCKIYSYLYFCDCIPYIYPLNFPDFGDDIKNATLCNLTHLKCLSRYACKFLFLDRKTTLQLICYLFSIATIVTRRPKKLIEGLEKELGDSIDCVDCYPLCSLSRYFVQATYSEIVKEEIMGGSWGIM